MTTQDSLAPTAPSVSVVVPAHNEERGIGALLGALLEGAEPGEVAVVVACNGCTDHTTQVAAGFGAAVTVLDLPVPSKRQAQRAGDAMAQGFPRAYVDADVVLGLADLRALAAPLRSGRVLATAPARRLDGAGCSWVVTRYYRVWERLPQVREGLFGRGVVVVSQEGAARILGLPDLLSDDLAMSEAFAPHEREIVADAAVTIRLPRTARDLVRRRVRVATGNVQADRLGVRGAGTSTSLGVLARLARATPSRAPDVAVFLVVTLVARVAARRRVRSGDFTTWLRDDSSRAPTG